jgi:hypothetical protein
MECLGIIDCMVILFLSNNSHNGAQSLMHLSLVETAHFSSKRHDCNIKEGIS